MVKLVHIIHIYFQTLFFGLCITCNTRLMHTKNSGFNFEKETWYMLTLYLLTLLNTKFFPENFSREHKSWVLTSIYFVPIFYKTFLVRLGHVRFCIMCKSHFCIKRGLPKRQPAKINYHIEDKRFVVRMALAFNPKFELIKRWMIKVFMLKRNLLWQL